MSNVRGFTRTGTLLCVRCCQPDLPNAPSEIPAWNAHAALLENAIEPYCGPSGECRLNNKFRYLIARAAEKIDQFRSTGTISQGAFWLVVWPRSHVSRTD